MNILKDLKHCIEFLSFYSKYHNIKIYLFVNTYRYLETIGKIHWSQFLFVNICLSKVRWFQSMTQQSVALLLFYVAKILLKSFYGVNVI